MRGQPESGFRLTEKRIANGTLTKQLVEVHQKIEQAQKKGKRLSPSLLQAKKTIARNQKVAQKHNLLSRKVSNMHPVDKSAIRRDVLSQVG